MLKKKAFAFMAALLMTASAAGCGKKSLRLNINPRSQRRRRLPSRRLLPQGRKSPIRTARA